MEQKFGIYILLGLAFGVVFGMGLGAANGNAIWGIWLGGLFGTYVGWFMAAAAQERQNEDGTDK